SLLELSRGGVGRAALSHIQQSGSTAPQHCRVWRPSGRNEPKASRIQTIAIKTEPFTKDPAAFSSS
ncbi:MAG: hypothetical protein ACRED4_07765, partial [Brevundimonas sp.]